MDQVIKGSNMTIVEEIERIYPNSKYKIIQSDSLDNLAFEVNCFLIENDGQGWRVHGAPVSVNGKVAQCVVRVSASESQILMG